MIVEPTSELYTCVEVIHIGTIGSIWSLKGGDSKI